MIINTTVNKPKHSFEKFKDAFLNKHKKQFNLNTDKIGKDENSYFECSICMEDVAKSPRKCHACELVNCKECSITWKQ